MTAGPGDGCDAAGVASGPGSVIVFADGVETISDGFPVVSFEGKVTVNRL